MIAAGIDFAAQDWLEAEILAGCIKIGRAEKIAMIGDGAGFHAEIHRSLTQILKPYRPVKQAVFSMAMKMREITLMSGISGLKKQCLKVLTPCQTGGKGRAGRRSGPLAPEYRRQSFQQAQA